MKAKKSERKILTEPPYNYNPEVIDLLDAESDKVRKGIPVDFSVAVAICGYQSGLQAIKKCQKNGGISGHNHTLDRTRKS